ncbi:MAG: hypothetical protein G01um101430_750 [Parcubacteria group bacterium Gr01-1014_30]|nr:MAG: hypothetical protein G01um101430_750 [Parcubacteria group bacterium Gr01-1014_30]
MFEVVATNKFASDFKILPSHIQAKTDIWLNKLRHDPFSLDFPIKKLKGLRNNFWRLKIDRNYRLIYSVSKNSLILYRIRHRKDIYQKF